MMDNPTVEHLLSSEKPLDTLNACQDRLYELISQTKATLALITIPEAQQAPSSDCGLALLSLYSQMERIQAAFDALVTLLDQAKA